MKNVTIKSKVVGRAVSSTPVPKGEAAGVDLSAYLQKEVWERAWEIRTAEDGQNYIFGKLPVALQYGLTMYVNGGKLNLPNIYAGLPIDNITLYWDNGILKAKGGEGGGGGVADSVAWENVYGKPTFAAVATSGKYSDLTGKPTLLSSFTDDIVSGKYLPLSGGTISNNGYALILNRESEDPVWIQFKTQNEFVGAIGGENGVLRFMDKNSKVNTVWHSGNFTPSDYLHLGGGILSNTLTIESSSVGLILHRSGKATPYIRFGENVNNEFGELGVYNDGRLVYWPLVSTQGGYNQWNTVWHEGNDGSGSGLEADYIGSYKKDSGEKNLIYGTRSDNTNLRRIYDNGWNLMCQNGNDNGVIATLSSNVASATKLQTVRAIWGQSFDGTGNVSGDLSSTGHITSSKHATYDVGNNLISYRYGYYQWVGSNSGAPFILGANNAYHIYINTSGNVGIGTPSPERNLVVSNKGAEGLELSWDSAYGSILTYNRSTKQYLPFSISASIVNIGVPGVTCNLLVNGGITMYSDQRKKTILNHVELSLKDIANAPLIEHYYNSDEKKTTHVGSIAQYWYGLNDWFCKKDSEGFLTMEIQNAALASAISIARELDRYETKTDKAIKKLKKRICELEDEVERLKSA